MADHANTYMNLRSTKTARASLLTMPAAACRANAGADSNAPFRLAPLRVYPTFPFLFTIYPERSQFFLNNTVKIFVFSALLFALLLTTAAEADETALKAPSFSLPDTQGSEVRLADLSGKVILLIFWATWCRSCTEEFAELDRLHRAYRDQGFIVIGISVDASAGRVAALLKKRPVGFPVVVDKAGTVAESYRLTGLPSAFLIGRNGDIERRYWGAGLQVISQYENDIISILQSK